MAARIRRELHTDVEMVHGGYGNFQVIVDGEILVDGGSLAFMGVLPSIRNVVEAVRTRLGNSPRDPNRAKRDGETADP